MKQKHFIDFHKGITFLYILYLINYYVAYENTTIWWVIAHLNQKPTESHCVIGEEIAIYLPLKDVLLSLGIF